MQDNTLVNTIIQSVNTNILHGELHKTIIYHSNIIQGYHFM